MYTFSEKNENLMNLKNSLNFQRKCKNQGHQVNINSKQNNYSSFHK